MKSASTENKPVRGKPLLVSFAWANRQAC